MESIDVAQGSDSLVATGKQALIEQPTVKKQTEDDEFLANIPSDEGSQEVYFNKAVMAKP